MTATGCGTFRGTNPDIFNDNQKKPEALYPNDGTPFLMVSDNHETLLPGDLTSCPGNPGVLWTHTVINNPTCLHRVFLWHLNQTGTSLVIGVTYQNMSNEPVLVGPTYFTTCLSGIKDNYLDAGQLLARSLLTDVYLAFNAPIFLDAFETGTLAFFTWPNADLRSAQLEIVIPAPDVPYLLSVVYANNASQLPTATTLPDCLNPRRTSPNIKGIHPRGAWAYSEGTNVFFWTPDLGDCFYEIHTPPDVFSETKSSALEVCQCNVQGASSGPCLQHKGADCAKTNAPPFGAIMPLLLAVQNDGCPRTIQLWIMPRGGNLAGAVRFNGGPVSTTGILLNNIQDKKHPVPHQQCYLITEIFLSASESQVYEIDLAIAGDSSSPAALFIQIT